MELGLAGLTVLVTGGTAGIGGGIVAMFAREGCNVAFCSRTQANVDAMLQSLAVFPVKAMGAAIDIADTKAFSAWTQSFRAIDIFIPNVSAISPDWETSANIDILSTVRCIDAVLPHLRLSRHAAITYIGSLACSRATPEAPGYAAAKAAMTHYMKSLSVKLAADQIRVNTVSPGITFVAGGWWDNMKTQAPQVFEAQLAAHPMRRFAEPDEIARVVAFISSPAASFVNGANWFADGGETQHIQY